VSIGRRDCIPKYNLKEERWMEIRYMKTAQAADYVGLAKATLNKDRCTRLLGIPYIKAGRAILYDKRDLDAWLESCKKVQIPVNGDR
jgi:Helix-turn-helix domain